MSGDGNNTPAATSPAITTTTTEQPPIMKCPRCDSPNTKFCYYNNYTQSQPRYFCKACRRYWTKGGALRCVPVGGSGRRIKKTMRSPRFADMGGAGGRRLGFFDGFVPPSSPIGFQAGGLKIPSVNSSAAALIRQLSALPPPPPPLLNPSFSLHQFDFLNNNLSFPFPGGAQEMGNLAAPPQIQPLITIDQDLPPQQIQEPQPMFFQNLEISTPPPQDTFGSSSRNAQDWVFDDFTFPSPVNTSGNENGIGNGNGDEWEDLIEAWANSNEYNVFP